MQDYVDDYEGELDIESAGWDEEAEIEDEDFDLEYEKVFSDSEEVSGDVDELFERDVVTGRKSKRPRMSVLNKSKVSKQELDELFLE